MTLEQLGNINFILDEYHELVEEIYFRYAEDYLGNSDIKEAKELAFNILENINTAQGIFCCAIGIKDTLGVDIRELLMQTQKEQQNAWKIDTSLSEIYALLKTFIMEH